MRQRPSFLFLVELAILGACFAWLHVIAGYTPYLDQSFFFDYNIAGQAVPVPITAQCDTINITWGSSAETTGPSPTAPYYLQVYTSTFIVPFVIEAGSGLNFDWTVPFSPDTLYQICMFDKFGHTGGCQGIYTVIAGNNTACTNVTFPAGALDVEGTVLDGPMSQYGWVDQCTDISILPKNGTPPFTLTIAPTLHPPFNISSNTMSAINWTVSLTWASPFFVSLVDSLGNTWANGPLHSGQGKSSSCLDADKASSTTNKPSVTVAAGLGAGIGGILLGILISYLFAQHRVRKEKGPENFVMFGQKFGNADSPPLLDEGISAADSRYTAVPSRPSSGPFAGPPPASLSENTLVNRYPGSGQYQVEPFVMPGEDGYRDPHDTPVTPGPPPSITLSQNSNPSSQPTTQDRSHVYVVHHDGGRPPVTVYTADGAEVVELPPRYAEGSGPAAQPRRPTANPTKAGGLRVR